MKPTSVSYLSEAACVGAEPRSDVAVISITERGRTAPLSDEWGLVCRVQFADAEWDDAMVQRLHARGIHFDPQKKGFPDSVVAQQLRDMISGIERHPGITKILVHCHAWRRRSAAVARYIAQRFNLPFDFDYDGYNRTVLRLLSEDAPRRVAHDRAHPRVFTRLLTRIFGGRR